MSHPSVDCARADRDELVARYLAGTMAGPEAEAFEEHFFGCEGCWAAVRRGVEVRAAFEEPAGETSPVRARPVPRRRTWWPLVAAAAVLIAAIASWRVAAPRHTGAVSVDEERAVAAPVVHVRADTSVLALVWSPVHGAAGYRVRLFTAEGAVLLDREVADTVLVPPAAAPNGLTGARVFWEVDALNGVRDVIARSALTPARVPAGPR